MTIIWREDRADTIDAGEGNDLIYGHDGDDRIIAGNGVNVVYAVRGMTSSREVEMTTLYMGKMVMTRFLDTSAKM